MHLRGKILKEISEQVGGLPLILVASLNSTWSLTSSVKSSGFARVAKHRPNGIGLPAYSIAATGGRVVRIRETKEERIGDDEIMSVKMN